MFIPPSAEVPLPIVGAGNEPQPSAPASGSPGPDRRHQHRAPAVRSGSWLLSSAQQTPQRLAPIPGPFCQDDSIVFFVLLIRDHQVQILIQNQHYIALKFYANDMSLMTLLALAPSFCREPLSVGTEIPKGVFTFLVLSSFNWRQTSSFIVRYTARYRHPL